LEKELVHLDEPASMIEPILDAGIIEKPSAVLSNAKVFVMAVACALSVANLYYVQPLLASMGHEFAVSSNQMGFIATLGQIGYAAGLLFIVPLGDSYNQRKLIVGMLCAVTISLLIMASAPSITVVTIASLLVGLTTVVPQMIIPFAASLATERNRGQVVGTIMSGLLIGILLARTVSGFIAAALGWRSMYYIAAALMIILAITMRFLLPQDNNTKHSMSYPRLLHSLWELIRDEPVLRETSLFGALTFGAFSAFWVVLSFFLETPPYHFDSQVAGLFGLVGVAGALAASVVGKIADRRDPRFANGLAMGIVLLSFVFMWLTGQYLAGLIVGVILLDLGTQGNQVTNQTRVYSLRAGVRNRLNTVYMFLYFVGGSIGSSLGTYGWSIDGWTGVCVVACLLMVIALLVFFANGKRMRRAV
jgi:predicted MFS family arabinose efflux permease